jgi:hypothetical protein
MLVVKYSNKFQYYVSKYSITERELKQFLTAKLTDPMGRYGKDKPYSKGELSQTKTWHSLVRGTDLYIVYRITGSNPHQLLIYGFTSHEDSGTGNPPKLNKQKTFAQQLSNMSFDSTN